MDEAAESQQLFAAIFDFLKSKPAHFFQFKRIYGRTTGYYKGDHIELDFKKDLVQTIIHETIHALKPELSETKVLKLEARVVRHITNIQAAELLILVGRKIRSTEKNQSYLKRQ